MDYEKPKVYVLFYDSEGGDNIPPQRMYLSNVGTFAVLSGQALAIEWSARLETAFRFEYGIAKTLSEIIARSTHITINLIGADHDPWCSVEHGDLVCTCCRPSYRRAHEEFMKQMQAYIDKSRN